MYMALFPTISSGCYFGTGGNAGPYGFKTIEDAKAGAQTFLTTAGNSSPAQSAPIIILDMDTLEIVAHVQRAPSRLPWVDRKR
jgi:hypothetical protein